ncbi:hypothetical protein [Desulfonauticus submarinus]
MRFIGLSIIFICLFSELCFAQRILVEELRREMMQDAFSELNAHIDHLL